MALSRRSFIAGLALVAAGGAAGGYAWTRRAAGAAHAAGDLYTCGMHSHLRLPKPGNCPICNMTLVKVGAPATAGTAYAGDGMHVAPEVQRSMGLETAVVASGPLARTIHAYASISPDDSAVVEVNPTVEGWLRSMQARGVGDRIRRGQVLYEIYSPELQQRQREYIDLLVRKDGLLANDSGMGGATNAMAGSLARERFRNRARLIAAGMDEELVEELERGRRIIEVVPVRALRDGVVTAIGARAGGYVTPMQQILAYADNRRLWAELTLFPDQLAWLKDGDRVRLRSTIDRGAVAEARVDLSAVQVDPGSRTARLRVAISSSASHGAAFAPGAFADATIATRSQHGLSIPREALIRTGAGDYVLRAAADNHFERVAIETGIESDEAIAVTAGLKAGDRVAVRAQFLLDGALALQANARPDPSMLPMNPDDPDICRTPPAAPAAPASPASHAGHAHGHGGAMP